LVAAVGVAVVGSVYASLYGSHVVDKLRAAGAPARAIEAAKHSIGAALEVARRAPDAVQALFVRAVKTSFIDGFHAGSLVGAGALVVAVIAVLLWLPARARVEDVDRQHAEHEAQRAMVTVPAGGSS
jgi:DHA2 family multidrug resistance protein-like MFS transporter